MKPTAIKCPHCRRGIAVINFYTNAAKRPTAISSKIFNKPIYELALPLRALNAFEMNYKLRFEDGKPIEEKDPIRTVGDLVQLSELELMRFPNFGKKSLADVKLELSKLGLKLGMLEKP
jgi:hypothetical protein